MGCQHGGQVVMLMLWSLTHLICFFVGDDSISFLFFLGRYLVGKAISVSLLLIRVI